MVVCLGLNLKERVSTNIGPIQAVYIGKFPGKVLPESTAQAKIRFEQIKIDINFIVRFSETIRIIITILYFGCL